MKLCCISSQNKRQTAKFVVVKKVKQNEIFKTFFDQSLTKKKLYCNKKVVKESFSLHTYRKTYKRKYTQNLINLITILYGCIFCSGRSPIILY